MADFTKEDLIEFRDISYLGYDLTGHNPFFLEKAEALQNTIKMYLMSQLGDYGRNIAKGGPLFPLIGKKAITTEELNTAIRNALKIYTNIVVLDVTSEFEGTRWKISLQFSDTINKIESSVSFGLQQ